MRWSVILAGFLVLVMAGLCFGQAAAAKGKPTHTMGINVTKGDDSKPQRIREAFAKLPLINFDDGLQCLLKHKGEVTAAYAEAANSGCKRVKVGQATVYNCGYYNSSEAAKCNAAQAKVDAIIKGCMLKPPVFKDHPAVPASGPDDINWDAWTEEVSPGCNSLGINCAVIPG